jgi:hypothetical protein
VVLFRCGAVWTRVEAAASRAARVRDAPAASWRCRLTQCSVPGRDPWTTAPGSAFHLATARRRTASTTRSSGKVKVCLFVYRDLQITPDRTSAKFTCSALRSAEKAVLCLYFLTLEHGTVFISRRFCSHIADRRREFSFLAFLLKTVKDR